MSKQRPVIITALCTLCFIAALVVLAAIPMMFSDLKNSIGTWYPIYLGCSVIVGFIAILGIWWMKRWGLYTYCALVLLNQVVLTATQLWSFTSLIIPVVFILICFTKFKQMD